ncbi:MAG: hypothetical protein QOF28_2309, partial [Actinomycetota bacterium]|nr:hypothetical protein [Actinomycetota bacterium]
MFRTAVVAAAAAALIVGPSLVTASGADVRGAASHAAPQQTPSEIGHASTALRAPARPLSTHPKVSSGYVAPTASSSLAGTSSTSATVAAPASARTWGPAGATTSTLVLYDTTDAYGWLGELYAIAAGNLASHFGRITAEPVVDYQAGQLNGFSAAIYLGSTYNEPIPVGFLNDVLANTKPVVWAGYNVWQLAGTADAAAAFQTAYGWDASTSYFDDTDSITQVGYNGQTLTRDPGAGSVLAPHITSTTGQVTVLGNAQCGTVAAPVACAPIAQTPPGATTFPWAIRSANLTYIGEIPLTYMNETDRYLAFSDLLFSVLQPAAPTVHRALVRLEDVGPVINTPAQLRATADYLASRNVPFSVAVIPSYTDPNGFYNGGTPKSLNISQTGNATVAAFNSALRYMVSKGGTLIEHGNTHQYSNVPNPYSGVSG